MAWTPEELRELEARPLDLARRQDFTEEQFALRLNMAKKLWDSLQAEDTTINAWARELFEIVPPWAVYTSEGDGKGLVCRVVNVHRKALCAEIVVGMPGGNVSKIVKISSLAHLRFRRAKVLRVADTQTPGLFIDPLAFYPFFQLPPGDMASFDPQTWVEEFEAARSLSNVEGMKKLRREVIVPGTTEYLKNVIGSAPIPPVVIFTEQLPPPRDQVLHREAETAITVQNKDSLDAERDLRAASLNPCVLNMASCHRPGGGWLNGAGAQEENLFYRSAYSLHLPAGMSAYPFKTPLTAIYTPDVLVFRENESLGFAFSQTARPVAFVAAAALRNPPLVDGALAPEAFQETKEKIRQVFRVALLKGHDSMVLGAWGCGAYGNPNRCVARAFREVLCGEDEFKRAFAAVVFAVLDTQGKEDGNFAVFNAVFNA